MRYPTGCVATGSWNGQSNKTLYVLANFLSESHEKKFLLYLLGNKGCRFSWRHLKLCLSGLGWWNTQKTSSSCIDKKIKYRSKIELKYKSMKLKIKIVLTRPASPAGDVESWFASVSKEKIWELILCKKYISSSEFCFWVQQTFKQYEISLHAECGTHFVTVFFFQSVFLFLSKIDGCIVIVPTLLFQDGWRTQDLSKMTWHGTNVICLSTANINQSVLLNIQNPFCQELIDKKKSSTFVEGTWMMALCVCFGIF